MPITSLVLEFDVRRIAGHVLFLGHAMRRGQRRRPRGEGFGEPFRKLSYRKIGTS